jgi:small redox-active disulfide protein 2
MKIKVLGSGCANCHKVRDLARQVIVELALEDATIQEVTDMKEIMKYPILATPGLVIDEKLVCAGRIPSRAEVTTWITSALPA